MRRKSLGFNNEFPSALYRGKALEELSSALQAAQ